MYSVRKKKCNLGLIRTFGDRAYKINNTWLAFHEDIMHETYQYIPFKRIFFQFI